MLKVLKVSKSGYYDFINRKQSKQKKRKEEIKEKVEEIHIESHEIYGAPKITKELEKKGYIVSQRYVGILMKELRIKAHYIKHSTRTTQSKDFSSTLKNVLNREFNPEKPNMAWCTDITYIWTYNEGFVYLTTVMDLFSRKIIAWVLTKTMEVDEVLKCIEIAKKRRPSDKPIIIHNDRGVQYTSKAYKALTKDMVASFSRKGNCWDNACIESFHALIKREWLYTFKIEDYNHAYTLVFEYIEAFYNTVRLHSHCDYLSPNQFEEKALEIS
jgi:transposase InsO family protein